MRKKKSRFVLHPIMAFIILIALTIVISGIFGAASLSTNYNIINAVRKNYETTTAAVMSLFSLSGIKLIFRSTVSNFAIFAPLSTLIIMLIGIGIMDKSGFLKSFFTLVTRKSNKFMVTFVLSLLTILASIAGDVMYIAFIPITALFFKYSRRNPKAGIILAYAGLTCGSAINIFMNSIDSALLNYSQLAATSIDSSYKIGDFTYLFVMLLMTFIMSLVITSITEKVTINKMDAYELPDEKEEFYLDRRAKRGLLFSLPVAFLYLLIFIYNIIPGLPFSGKLLDYSQVHYIDKLFGYNSFFNQGFIFVITLFFFLCGLLYGIGARTIKDNNDVAEYLGHSLDGIGKTLVLIFFAASFISIFKASNIGEFLAASMCNFITSTHMSGLSLIIVTFVMVMIISIFIPTPVTSWSILSGSIVPVFMSAGMTPEFAELVFRSASSVTFGLSPMFAYFVIYLAFLDNYNKEKEPMRMSQSIKYLLPYAGATLFIWLIIILIIYVTGLPFGLSSTATL